MVLRADRSVLAYIFRPQCAIPNLLASCWDLFLSTPSSDSTYGGYGTLQTLMLVVEFVVRQGMCSLKPCYRTACILNYPVLPLWHHHPMTLVLSVRLQWCPAWPSAVIGWSNRRQVVSQPRMAWIKSIWSQMSGPSNSLDYFMHHTLFVLDACLGSGARNSSCAFISAWCSRMTN